MYAFVSACQLVTPSTPHIHIHTHSQALPPKVTLPPVQPEVPPPPFGLLGNAERHNRRACMIGFFALIALEFVTQNGLLDMLGFTTGNGLGFEF